MPFEKSAGAIIFYREKDGTLKYLLLNKEADAWHFPKGLIEKGETETAAARREIKEEAGLNKIKIIPDFKTWEKFFFKVKYPYQLERGLKKGQTVMKVVIYFLFQALTKDVKVSFEHQGFEWLSFDEAFERLKKYKNSQEILKKAHEFLAHE